MNIGYACQNMELSNLGKGKRVTMNRSCIRRTYDEKGIDYISELSLKNALDLERLLNVNIKIIVSKITFFVKDNFDIIEIFYHFLVDSTNST